MLDKLVLVGPSSDVGNFDSEFFQDKRKKGFKILSFADSLLHLEKIDIAPEFWSFVDPFCLKRYYRRFNNNFYKNITLVTPDLYSEKFSNFFKAGYTCNNLKRDPKAFEEISSLDFSLFFNQHIKLDYKIINYSNSIDNRYNFSDILYLIQRKGKNQCKFTHNLIPLLLYHFKELKEIVCIGFGHYNLSRYIENGNKRGYEEFKQSFNIIKELVKTNIKRRNIKITFEGQDSLFKQLVDNE